MNKEHPTNLETAFAYPNRTMTELLGYVTTNKHKLNKRRVHVIDYLKGSLESSVEQQACNNTSASTFAVVRSSSGTTSEDPFPDEQEAMTHQKIDLAALVYSTDPVAEVAAVTIQLAKQRVSVPKQSMQITEEVLIPILPTTTQTKAPKASKWKRDKGKDVVEGFEELTLVEEWLPPLEHEGHPITMSDNVTASRELAFNLFKVLLLPLWLRVMWTLNP